MLTQVENILQANENSYKLCDFGSATTVTKAPTTVAEMRALESDLNKHTTLQYRAPEMVDPHLRRPIDEKSGQCRGHRTWSMRLSAFQMCGLWGCSSTNYVIIRHRSRNMVHWPFSMSNTKYHLTRCIPLRCWG